MIPLIVNRSNNALVEPTYKNGTFLFTDQDDLSINCPGERIKIKNKETKLSSATIKCVNGPNFSVSGTAGEVPFSAIECTDYPRHLAKYTRRNCLGNASYKEIEIGFNLTNNFLRNILVCFDTKNQNALYSTFNMSAQIKGSQVRIPRLEFIQGSFYDVWNTNVNSLYVRGGQRKTINGLLGMSNNNYTYVSKSDDFYLSRGHLTAKADFVYGSQQRSTFYYVNVAPQWQPFNEGNWNELEQSVRFFVGKGTADIRVYTGTHGVLTLPHAQTGKPVKLYLYVNGKGGSNGIAVPELYWKIVYDPKRQLGTAFVGLNDPYFGEKHEKVCKDVSAQISWLRWDQRNQTAGISYSCSVDDLRRTVTTIPEFVVKGLLK